MCQYEHPLGVGSKGTVLLLGSAQQAYRLADGNAIPALAARWRTRQAVAQVTCVITLQLLHRLVVVLDGSGVIPPAKGALEKVGFINRRLHEASC